jgi:hypothetical protein
MECRYDLYLVVLDGWMNESRVYILGWINLNEMNEE